MGGGPVCSPGSYLFVVNKGNRKADGEVTNRGNIGGEGEGDPCSGKWQTPTKGPEEILIEKTRGGRCPLRILKTGVKLKRVPEKRIHKKPSFKGEKSQGKSRRKGSCGGGYGPSIAMRKWRGWPSKQIQEKEKRIYQKYGGAKSAER